MALLTEQIANICLLMPVFYSVIYISGEPNITKSIADMKMPHFTMQNDDDNTHVISGDAVQWTDNMYNSFSDSWSSAFLSASSNRELISLMKLTNSTYTGTLSQLNILCRDNDIKASDTYKNISDEQIYCYKETSGTVNSLWVISGIELLH